MRRLSLIFASLAAATIVVGLTAFAFEPAGFSGSSVALISLGLLLCTMTAVTGFLLVRAPWGRWGLCGVTGAAMVLATTNQTAMVFGVMALGAVAIVGLAGPWVRFWVRQQPVSDGLNTVAVSLVAVAPVAPLIVGLAAYDESHWLHWLAAVVAVGSSFLYARGLPGGLWLLRLAVPVSGIAAFTVCPLPSALLVGVGSLAVGLLAWLPGAAAVTATPTPPLPAPRPLRKVRADADD
ncbi:MAG: hypothetical protein M5U23_05935 [Acidimicrobiia bacterium]|nr:hypothetical protein [Acidimicrobiia bacterium]